MNVNRTYGPMVGIATDIQYVSYYTTKDNKQQSSFALGERFNELEALNPATCKICN